MKKSLFYLFALVSILLVSCSGRDGLNGFDGRDGEPGPPGPAFEAAAFEIEVDLGFNGAGNVYEFGPELYPADISLIQDDVILIYRLEEVNQGLDVWRQLPQPFFSNEGLVFYNFDFTQNDYTILLEPEFDANLVALDLVQAQVFRIVVIPGDLGTGKVDKSNMQSVLDYMGINEDNIQRIKLN